MKPTHLPTYTVSHLKNLYEIQTQMSFPTYNVYVFTYPSLGKAGTTVKTRSDTSTGPTLLSPRTVRH